MNKIFLTLLLCTALTACGGGGNSTSVFTDPESPIVSPVETKPGHADGSQNGQDGTATPPTDGTPCEAPQASEQGVAHGKPPVGRCNV